MFVFEFQRGETCEVGNVYSQVQINIGWMPSVVAVLLVVAVLYIRIGQLAWRASRDVKQVGPLELEATNQNPANKVITNQNAANNSSSQSKAQKRITTVLSLVIGVFVVTYVPSAIVLTLATRFPPSHSIGWFLAFFIVLWNINTFINPIIYAWKNRDFKKAFYILFKRKLPPELLD